MKNIVFEGDFRVDSSTKNYALQVIMGTAYMFTLRVDNGQVRIVESSSSSQNNSVDNDFGVSVPLG